MLIHFDEAFLCRNEIKGQLFQKQWLNQFEKPLSIELQKPFEKLFCCYKPNNIKNVHSPFENGKITHGELFAL
jgi:hypothetical protein